MLSHKPYSHSTVSFNLQILSLLHFSSSPNHSATSASTTSPLKTSFTLTCLPHSHFKFQPQPQSLIQPYPIPTFHLNVDFDLTSNHTSNPNQLILNSSPQNQPLNSSVSLSSTQRNPYPIIRASITPPFTPSLHNITANSTLSPSKP